MTVAQFSYRAALEATVYQTLTPATLPTTGPVASVERVELTTSTDWMPRFEATVVCASNDQLLGAVVDGKVQQYTYLTLRLERVLRYGVALATVDALWSGDMEDHNTGWGGDLAALTDLTVGPLPEAGAADQHIELTMMVREIKPDRDGLVTVQLASAEMLLDDLRVIDADGGYWSYGEYGDYINRQILENATPDGAPETAHLVDALFVVNVDGDSYFTDGGDTWGDALKLEPGVSLAEQVFDVIQCRIWAETPTRYRGTSRELVEVVGPASTAEWSRWRGLHVLKVEPTYKPNDKGEEGRIHIVEDRQTGERRIVVYGETGIRRGKVVRFEGKISPGKGSYRTQPDWRHPKIPMSAPEIVAAAMFEVRAGQSLDPALLAAAPGPGAPDAASLTAQQIVWLYPEGTMTITAIPRTI